MSNNIILTPDNFFDEYKKSVFDKNIEQMISLYDNEIVMYDMWNKYSIVGISDLLEMVKNWFESLNKEKVFVDFSNITTKFDDNYAFSYAYIHYKAVSENNIELRSMKNRITLCFTRKNNQWIVIHQHTSIPISSTNITGIFE